MNILWSTDIVLLLLFKDIYLPWRMLMKRENYNNVWGETVIRKNSSFCVRKPDMIPRRNEIPRRKKRIEDWVGTRTHNK